MFFSKNLKFLRSRSPKITQQKLADRLGFTRSAIVSYEQGRAEPSYDNLLKISGFFNVSADQLLRVDLSKTESEEIQEAYETEQYAKAENLRILTITTDQSDNENIELVPVKASAGYTNGYADQEYLKELPKYQLPFLPKGKTYRAFEIQGDSMLPLQPRSIVIGEYVENWSLIKDGQICVVVARDLSEGVVLKQVFSKMKEKQAFLLKSNNVLYPPYEVSAKDIIEFWKFTAYISRDFPQDPHSEVSDLKEAFRRMEDDLWTLKTRKQEGWGS